LTRETQPTHVTTQCDQRSPFSSQPTYTWLSAVQAAPEGRQKKQTLPQQGFDLQPVF
jgi:hypothetical protein